MNNNTKDIQLCLSRGLISDKSVGELNIRIGQINDYMKSIVEYMEHAKLRFETIEEKIGLNQVQQSKSNFSF